MRYADFSHINDTLKMSITNELPDSAFPITNMDKYFIYYPKEKKTIAMQYLYVKTNNPIDRKLSFLKMNPYLLDSTRHNYVFKPLLKSGFVANPESLIINAIVYYR